MKRVLFLCSQNCLRSPTAEEVFRGEPGWGTSSAGTDADAEVPVTGEMLERADVVAVMENHHRRQLLERFPDILKDKRLVVLGIRDEYERMEPELIEKLHTTASKWKTDEPEKTA